MYFPREYFKPEIREGFYVSSRMKRTWAATLEVLDAVRNVCRKHGIRYYADWGTMLGAVRHGGFIPWDDDLDICMLRKDYMEFLQIVEEELPEDYAVLNMYTESEYTNLLTRVVNHKSLPVTDRELESSHGFPFVAGIDIFPLDYVCRDKGMEDAKWGAISLIKMYANVYDSTETSLDDSRGGADIRYLMQMLKVNIRDDLPVKQQLYQMIDIVASMYSEEHGDYVSTMSDETRGKAIPVSYYDESIDIPFECTTITVPLLYDDMLVTKYGDYMRIVKSWDTHEYPVYRGIEKEARAKGATVIWKNYMRDKALEDIKRQEADRKNTSGSKDAVFMPHDVASWRRMEPLWAMLKEDPVNNVYVMPVPYYLKNDIGEPRELHYEGALVSEYADIISFDSYDLKKEHPFRIVTAIPYDQYDTTITLPEIFFSDRIREYTDHLTYIGDFSIDDFEPEDGRSVLNMDYYCTVPGIINSDEVFVKSEIMRDRYIEKLAGFIGDEYREYFEKKIMIAPWGADPGDNHGINEDDIPDEWWPKLLDANGEGKKVILYYNNMSCIAQYKDRYIDKINSVFELFNDNSERITVIWIIDKDFNSLKGNVYKGYDDTVDRIYDIVKRYSKLDNIIVYNEDTQDKAIAISDAFYGDRGVLMNRFRRTGRPIMIQSVKK